jgi:hypothetical protein
MWSFTDGENARPSANSIKHLISVSIAGIRDRTSAEINPVDLLKKPNLTIRTLPCYPRSGSYSIPAPCKAAFQYGHPKHLP